MKPLQLCLCRHTLSTCVVSCALRSCTAVNKGVKGQHSQVLVTGSRYTVNGLLPRESLVMDFTATSTHTKLTCTYSWCVCVCVCILIRHLLLCCSHLFAIANLSYTTMMDAKKDQCIVIRYEMLIKVRSLKQCNAVWIFPIYFHVLNF